MGIERARVTEVHSPTSATGRAGSGYLVSDRLVLTAGVVAGRRGPTHVRPVGAGSWVAASLVWFAGPGGAAVVEIDDLPALMVPPAEPSWGELGGSRPVGVTAVGFPPADGRPEWPRDPVQFLGRVDPSAGAGRPGPLLPVAAGPGTPTAGDGLSGAALFAGAQLVGVLVADGAGGGPVRLAAVPVTAMATDDAFARVVGDDRGLALTPVSTPASGFPILHLP